MMAIYPSRGCPFSCNFCTIYKFAGHSVRSQSIETTLDSIRNARAAGVKIVVFTCDNTNKMGELPELCDAMVAENLATPFMCQCDAQIVRQEWLLAKMSRAGCRVIMIGVESFSREALKKAGKGHNQPDQYAEIARMCKRHGIVTVFSNIIGMPEDTEASVREHVRLLKLASPAAAYFFILTPIPGSDQYADFRSQGLITERNLDRFDATHPCWTHPNLSHDQLKRLMWESIESYHGLGNNLWRTIGSLKLGVSPTFAALGFGYAGLMKYKARRREHQIVGGLGRFRLDAARNYSLLRRKTYGFDHFPLPDNLSLPETDLAADQMRLRDKDHLLRISPAGETVRA